MKTKLTFFTLFLSTLLFAQVDIPPEKSGFTWFRNGNIEEPNWATSGVKCVMNNDYLVRRYGTVIFDLDAKPQNDSIVLEMEIQKVSAYTGGYPHTMYIYTKDYAYDGDDPKPAGDLNPHENTTLVDSMVFSAAPAVGSIVTVSSTDFTSFVNGKIANAASGGNRYLTFIINHKGGGSQASFEFKQASPVLKLAKVFTSASFRDAVIDPERVNYNGETDKLIIDFTGTKPYEVVYNNGTQNITVSDINDDSLAIDVSLSADATYSLVSITGGGETGDIIAGDVNYTFVQQTAVLCQSYYIPTGVSTDSMFANIILDGVAPFNIALSTGQNFVVEESDLSDINSFICKVPTEISQSITLSSASDNVGGNCTLSGAISPQDTVGSGTKVSPSLDGFVKGTSSAITDFTSDLIELRKDGNNYNREAFFTFDLTGLNSTDVLSLAYVQLYCTYVNNSGHISYLRLTKIDPSNEMQLDTMTYAGGLQTLNLTEESNQSYFAGIIKADYTDKTVVIDIKDILNDAINAGEDSISLRLDNHTKDGAYYKFAASENTTVEKQPFLYYEIDTTTELEKAESISSTFYPNPTSSTLTFETAEQRIIYNLSGQQMMSSQQRIVNVSGLDNGVYLIKTGNTIERFIKTK